MGAAGEPVWSGLDGQRRRWMAAEAFVLSHFGLLVGSPSFSTWLTKELERRLQAIV
jgi:hypothetical protein